jgi:hypothetical protein
MDDFDDDTVMTQLRHIAAEVDPVPPAVLAAARAAILTRDLDGELATLVADSQADSAELGFEQVRSGAAPSRLLTFEGAGVQVDVEVTGQADDLGLVGTVTGTEPQQECVLEGGDGGRRPLHLDDLGRFMVDAVPPGPARLRCRSAGGSWVTTAWVRL